MSEHLDEPVIKRPDKRNVKIKVFVGTFTSNEDKKAQAVRNYVADMETYFKSQLKQAQTGPMGDSKQQTQCTELDMKYKYYESPASSGENKVHYIEKLCDEAEDLAAGMKKAADRDKADMEKAIGKEEFASRLQGVKNTLDALLKRYSFLNEADLVAIRGYTLVTGDEKGIDPNKDADYKDMNRLLRGLPLKSDKEKNVAIKNLQFEKALRKLPNYSGNAPVFHKDVIAKADGEVLWAEWPKFYESLQVNGEYAPKAFWSCGKTGVVSGEALASVIWTVDGRSAKDIADMAQFKEGGGEVVFLPNAKFKVLDRNFEDGAKRVWRLTVQEVTK
jgi:hypothetical protein